MDHGTSRDHRSLSDTTPFENAAVGRKPHVVLDDRVFLRELALYRMPIAVCDEDVPSAEEISPDFNMATDKEQRALRYSCRGLRLPTPDFQQGPATEAETDTIADGEVPSNDEPAPLGTTDSDCLPSPQPRLEGENPSDLQHC